MFTRILSISTSKRSLSDRYILIVAAEVATCHYDFFLFSFYNESWRILLGWFFFKYVAILLVCNCSFITVPAFILMLSSRLTCWYIFAIVSSSWLIIISRNLSIQIEHLGSLPLLFRLSFLGAVLIIAHLVLVCLCARLNFCVVQSGGAFDQPRCYRNKTIRSTALDRPMNNISS